MVLTQTEQLLRLVEKNNPEWYNYVYGFVKGQLDHLELDNSDIEINDIDQQELSMNQNESCIVGELFGFSSHYLHGDNRDTIFNEYSNYKRCDTCTNLALKLFNDSDNPANSVPFKQNRELQRESFIENLTELYKHWGFMK
jgi:hypothetical protein